MIDDFRDAVRNSALSLLIFSPIETVYRTYLFVKVKIHDGELPSHLKWVDIQQLKFSLSLWQEW
jgi:hypothetical protein